MTKQNRTWLMVGLAILILVLLLWLRSMKRQTQTSVKIADVTNPGTTTFSARNELNQALLRICSYDSGSQLTLDPGAVGGKCPPVFTTVDGKTGYLQRDEVIVIPNAGQGIMSIQ